MALPSCSCPLLVYLADGDQGTVKLSGVYLPLKGGRTAETQWEYRGRKLVHLLAGDCNHPSWLSGYRLWTGTRGLWELSNPAAGTFGSGNSLDKCLFCPGDSAPLALLPSSLPFDTGAVVGVQDDAFYPAYKRPMERLGNRCPVMLEIPCGREQHAKPGRALKLRGITPEQGGAGRESLWAFGKRYGAI